MSDMECLTFWQWLRAQQKREGPIGEFARDNLKGLPVGRPVGHNVSELDWLVYLHDSALPAEYREQMLLAWEEYRLYLAERGYPKLAVPKKHSDGTTHRYLQRGLYIIAYVTDDYSPASYYSGALLDAWVSFEAAAKMGLKEALDVCDCLREAGAASIEVLAAGRLAIPYLMLNR